MSSSKKIETKKAPAAIGPYSQGIVIKDLIFTSGQIGLDPDGNIKGGITEQTKQVIKNLEAVLLAGGSNLGNVIKTTVYLKNMADFAKMNEVYETYFKNKPVRSTVGVSALPKNALIEIECIATKKI